MNADKVMSEVLDHFCKSGETPGDWWAFSDDEVELCLEHTSSDGSTLWIDLSRDGTIMLLWKSAGSEKPQVLQFVAKEPPK